MQHKLCRRKNNNRAPNPDIHAEDVEQSDHTFTLWGSSQNPRMHEPKIRNPRRAMLKKKFLNFGRKLQIEPPSMEKTSPPSHDDL